MPKLSDESLCIKLRETTGAQHMSNLSDAMTDAIKRRIEKAPTTTAQPMSAKEAERLASEAAQRKAYEQRQKAGK